MIAPTRTHPAFVPIPESAQPRVDWTIESYRTVGKIFEKIVTPHGAHKAEATCQRTLAFPLLPPEDSQFEETKAAEVAFAAITAFLALETKAVCLLFVSPSPSPMSELLSGCNDPRLKVHFGDICALQTEGQPAMCIVNPTNWRFRGVGGSAINERINQQAGPDLERNSRSNFQAAEIGRAYPIELSEASPLWAQQVRWVLQVRCPNMNPKRPDCLEPQPALELLGKCYQSMFAAFTQILQPSTAPNSQVSGAPLVAPSSARLSAASLSTPSAPSLELILMQGPPCAGKTTFYMQRLRPQGYIHVNQDTLKTQARCLQAVEQSLSRGRSCCVDNTNPSKQKRALFSQLAKRHGAAVRCICFATSASLAQELNRLRHSQGSPLLPPQAFSSYYHAFEPPEQAEGFTVEHVDFSSELSAAVARTQRNV